MDRPETLSAKEAFHLICNVGERTYLDVRSEDEFAAASFAPSINIPILNNVHRHLVGIEYKTKGPERAVELGLSLVAGKSRDEMLRSWCQAFRQNLGQGFVFCWRGGSRSGFAQAWLREEGYHVPQVVGGYKAMRRLAINLLAQSYPLIVVGGPAGAGKTDLLQGFASHIDLEQLANHRGSSFGLKIGAVQPHQATFENHLAQKLYRLSGPILIEDESRLIGRLVLPEAFFLQITTSAMVLLEEPIERRATRIYRGYVYEPLSARHDPGLVQADLSQSLEKIRRRLGGVLYQQIIKKMAAAFTSGVEEDHHLWIVDLLRGYYDKLYSFSLARRTHKILFRGDQSACTAFLKESLKEHHASF